MSEANLAILVYVLLALVVILITLVIRQELRIKKLLTGTDKFNLEKGILDVRDQHEHFGVFKTNVENQLAHMDKRLKGSVRGVSTLRFDAMTGGGAGGNQSFATALVDEYGNGVVVSTLQTRERVGVFSKPLKNGTSEYELTEEEAKAVADAKSKL